MLTLHMSIAPDAVVPLLKRLQAPDAAFWPDVRQRVVEVRQCVHLVLSCSREVTAGCLAWVRAASILRHQLTLVMTVMLVSCRLCSKRYSKR